MTTYGVTSYLVGGTSYPSYSSRIPCPSGTSLGYGTFNFNGTELILLYCHSAFNEKIAPVDLALALGLGLGVGIPFLIVVLCWGYELCCFNPYRKYTLTRNIVSNRVESTAEEKLARAKQIVNRLPSSILHDFERGILTEQLRQELMLIRMEAGSNLTEYAMVAESQNHRFLAWWIRDMNPGSFPPEFQRHWREIRAGTYQLIPQPSAPPAIVVD